MHGLQENHSDRADGPLRRSKTIVLTTYKRDGTPVPTPVSLAAAGDRLFFRSYDRAWKTKRLRHNPAVQVAPSTFRGRATAPAVPARASLLHGEDARVAPRACPPPAGATRRGRAAGAPRRALPDHALRTASQRGVSGSAW